MRTDAQERSALPPANRLLSLDVMRGIIMILLAGESALLYDALEGFPTESFIHQIAGQFFHHPWHGLHFWDLVQPAFMTMAGTAMYLSFHKKSLSGVSWLQNGKQVLIRAFRLLLCGVLLHCVYAGKLVWELWNVLSQLAFTTIVAYCFIRSSIKVQVLVSLVILLMTEILYRTVLMPGFDQPFAAGKNFGSWMDMVLMGKLNTDYWVAINCLPSAVHTIAGVAIGKLLLHSEKRNRILLQLFIAAIVCLVAGYGLDLLNITPIIKRICTSSFILVSLGWVILLFWLFYYVVDILEYRKYAWVVTVVGMNAIFIYLFFETAGRQWLNGVVQIFSGGLSNSAGVAVQWEHVITALCVLVVEWVICYWLYKRKIFFKL